MSVVSLIVTLGTLYIAVTNSATYSFTSFYPITSHPGLLTFSNTHGSWFELHCTPNEDCTVNCQGVGSCHTNGLIIKGPGSQNALNLNVDSQVPAGTTTQAITFRGNLNCKIGGASCSEINIKVEGSGIDTMIGTAIYTPDHGVTTLDCSGPAVSGGFVCSQNILFYGTQGLGRAPGQVYIMDVSGTAGRTTVGSGIGISYWCTNSQGLIVQDRCNTMMMRWNNQNPKYLECSAKHLWPPHTPLSCQVTLSPTAVTVNNAPAVPAPKTVWGGSLGGPMGFPLARNDDAAIDSFKRSSEGSGYLISEKDYYLMRICEGIVLIGILALLAKLCMVVVRCCNQRGYAYSEVKYNTDITTDEEI